jgi:DNA-binding response OmpR family regulator
LIVLDLSLPDGSGFDVLRWISRRDGIKHIHVIVFTASTDPEHARMAEQFGVLRYLEKPAHLGDLVATIKEELRGGAAPQASDEGSGSATG